jgi:hypothetical protein
MGEGYCVSEVGSEGFVEGSHSVSVGKVEYLWCLGIGFLEAFPINCISEIYTIEWHERTAYLNRYMAKLKRDFSLRVPLNWEIFGSSFYPVIGLIRLRAGS